jgi:xanthine dehydrogenase YagS FAD-binding subunit
MKIVCGGLAPIPWRLKKAEDSLRGKALTEDVIRQRAREALKDAKPLEENAFKVDLVEAVLVTAIASML